MSVVGLAFTGEDEGHFRAVTQLIDASVVEGHSWLDGILDDCRRWHGLASGEQWYKYDPKDALDIRPLKLGHTTIQPLGHIKGEPLKDEAGMWRRVLLMFAHHTPRPEVVVLVRDLDGHHRRRDGIDQVRHGFDWPFRIVAATPEPEIEGWHVAGFVPADDKERKRFSKVKRTLSFDPTIESHRLTSHPNDASTDTKRVLAHLVGRDHDRTMECLNDRVLLAQRGGMNGLASFLDEVRTEVLPVFRGPS